MPWCLQADAVNRRSLCIPWPPLLWVPGKGTSAKKALVRPPEVWTEFESPLNAPSSNIEPSLNVFEQKALPVHSGVQSVRTPQRVMNTDRLNTFVHPLRTSPCPSNDAILPSIQLPPVFRPTMMPGYLPSAMVTADRIFSDPKKRPEARRPEVDLQCINPAGLSCIHERNRAAPAASPTYTSRNTPPLASTTKKS
jgi:hypothetical protein